LSAYAGPGLDYFNQDKSVIAFSIDVVKSLRSSTTPSEIYLSGASQNDEMADWIDVGSGTHGM
jgi:hypothetical protein